jgi:cytochrome P450
MQAVINEGLRMVPPVITGFPKRVPPGGDYICGRFVPGGVDIFTNCGEILRDRAVFGEAADVFRPERFLTCKPEQKLVMLKSVDLIFGHGRFKCSGQLFAWMELNKIFVEVRAHPHFLRRSPKTCAIQPMPMPMRGASG